MRWSGALAAGAIILDTIELFCYPGSALFLFVRHRAAGYGRLERHRRTGSRQPTRRCRREEAASGHWAMSKSYRKQPQPPPPPSPLSLPTSPPLCLMELLAASGSREGRRAAPREGCRRGWTAAARSPWTAVVLARRRFYRLSHLPLAAHAAAQCACAAALLSTATVYISSHVGMCDTLMCAGFLPLHT